MERNFEGFTIVELLMAMMILGVLAIMPIVVIRSGAARSRNITRQNDLRSYQNAIEVYYSKQGTYPLASLAGIDASTLCGILNMDSNECKKDPSGDISLWYTYRSSADGLLYRLSVVLEGSSVTSFVLCSNGENGIITGVPDPTTSDCPDF